MTETTNRPGKFHSRQPFDDRRMLNFAQEIGEWLGKLRFTGLVWGGAKNRQLQLAHLVAGVSLAADQPTTTAVESGDLPWATKRFDTAGSWATTANTKLTVVLAQPVAVVATLAWEAQAAGVGLREVSIYKNGVLLRRNRQPAIASAADGNILTAIALDEAVVGDSYTVRARQTSGGNLNVLAVGSAFELGVTV